ncbi:uncharacterized protein LOC128739393 [Sabethes cyaneus]|uniref:uncharacterized protein LOC128739393 n=1 Tax=Sabethes cyaneus TaxID=53552 RepID=UPI00237EC120|nr:uncharacterized protein LOC128739393 [Sabethes cyaneus]
MRWFRIDDFFQSIRPVYLAARIFLLHFETVDFQRRTHRRTLLDQLGLVLTLMVDLFLGTVALRNLTAMLEMSDSVLLNLGYYASFMLATMIALAIPTWNSWQVESLFEIYANIASVDDDLKQLGITVDHQKHHFVSTFMTSIAAFISSFLFAGTTYTFFVEGAFTFTKQFSEYLMVVPFLRSTLTTQEFSPKSIKDTYNFQHTIRKFATLHDLLCDTVEFFNRCYSIQAMVALTACFGFTIFSVFGVIHSYASQADNDTLLVSWSNMIYDTLPLYFIAQIVLCSGSLHAECKQTAVLIHKAISYGTCNRKLLRELRTFSQQLEHHAPKISCRVFDFDWVLFFTMAGSLATHLVILVQFDLVNFSATNPKFVIRGEPCDNTIQPITKPVPNRIENSITIYYENVRGLRTKIDDLFLAASDVEYDIIVFTETWLNEEINSAQLFGANYTVYRNDRDPIATGKKRGGGALIVVSSKISSYMSTSLVSDNIEHLWVNVHGPDNTVAVAC